jgi:hypothetical protein
MKTFFLFLFAMIAAVTSVRAQEDDDEKTEKAQSCGGTNGCGGVERWSQKALTDALENTIDFTPKPTSIAHLVSIVTPTPSTSMTRYQPVEDSTYIVTCNIPIKKAESDSDFHLVLSNGTQTLIGEIPDPICASVAASPYACQFQTCRNFINAHFAAGNVSGVNLPPITVTGVAFVDPPHGQTGAAPNNLELHPIINIYFATATGMEEYNLDNVISVSPNPSSDGKIHIQSTKYKFQKVDIYNSHGDNIGLSSKPDIDLSTSPNGVYFLRIRTDKGSAVKKVIINH